MLGSIVSHDVWTMLTRTLVYIQICWSVLATIFALHTISTKGYIVAAMGHNAQQCPRCMHCVVTLIVYYNDFYCFDQSLRENQHYIVHQGSRMCKIYQWGCDYYMEEGVSQENHEFIV
jgi:hypothetical protein